MELTIALRLGVALPEVSGLGWRRTPDDGARELLVVGDRTHQLGLARWGAGDEPSKGDVRVCDLAGLCARRRDDPSQWEAVAGDGAGRVFALRESPSAVLVFDPSLEALAHTIELTVPDESEFAEAWARDDNSRGEGLVLLRSGHLLVLKEKLPTMVLEFGPAGARPQGYAKGSALRFDEAFSLPRGRASVFVPLAGWRLARDAQQREGDLSDLACDAQGRLFALSDQGRSLVRLESNLRPDERVMRAKERWTLPGAIDKPEGLALTPAGAPVVARDTKASGGSLFVLAMP